MSYLQARKDKMKPNSRRGAIFGKEMAQSPKIFAMSSNQVKAPRESFLEEGLDLVASLDPVTQEINIERMTAALQAIVLDPTNLKLAEDELKEFGKYIVSNVSQYLRQISRGFCMNSTDFCGLENAIVN